MFQYKCLIFQACTCVRARISTSLVVIKRKVEKPQRDFITIYNEPIPSFTWLLSKLIRSLV